MKHGRRRRKRGSRKDSRGIIHNRVSIRKRTKVLEQRERVGDIESDFMVVKDHKGDLLVMFDRASLYIRLNKLKTRNSKKVSKSMIKRLHKSEHPLHTMTLDNDKGFSDHSLVADTLDIDTYFIRPCTSQDKGTVENRIGQIRRFFLKRLTSIW